MSPNYENWRKVPDELQKLVRLELKRLELDIAPLIQRGFAFILDASSEPRITRMVASLDTLNDG